MRIGTWLTTGSCLLVCSFAGCKNKLADQELPPSSVEVEETIASEPNGPTRIDPQSEADDAPKPAVAGLPADPTLDEIDPLADKEITERDDREYSVGSVGQIQLVRLFADGFSNLPRRSRALVYHLTRAILAGRDIGFDQIHKNGLEVRQLLESVLLALKGKGKIEPELADYYKLMSINGGFYDRFSGLKFVPNLSPEQFEAAIKSAHAAGAEMDLHRDESVEEVLSRLRKVLFDPNHQANLTGNHTGRRRPDLSDSPLNLYKGVNRRALKGFDEHHPHNSRLVRIDGRLVEEVYRTGDRRRKLAPGRYARQLRRVVDRLNTAMASAKRSHRLLLGDLIEYFRSGDPFAFDAVLDKWRSQVADVEFLMGFIDRTLDPRGAKGLYLGLVGTLDRPNTSRLEALLRHLQEFEDRMPWGLSVRKRWTSAPRVAAIHLLSGAGMVAPMCPFSFRIEPDRGLGQLHAGKILVLTNVVDSHRRAVGLPIARTFLPEATRERVLAESENLSILKASLREVLGFELGKVSADVRKQLGDSAPVLAALKADLVALWLMSDERLQDMRIFPEGLDTGVAWDFFVTEALVLDSLAGAEPVSHEAQASRILLRVLIEREKVVVFEGDEGQRLVSIPDKARFTKALEVLLVHVATLLAEADRGGTQLLLRQFAALPAWPERDSFALRARKVGLRRSVAYLLPKLKPRRSTLSGRIDDATVSNGESLENQLLRIGLVPYPGVTQAQGNDHGRT